MGAILSSLCNPPTVHLMPDALWHLQLLQWSIHPVRPTYSFFGCTLRLSHTPPPQKKIQSLEIRRTRWPRSWSVSSNLHVQTFTVSEKWKGAPSSWILSQLLDCKNIGRSYRVAVLSSVHKCHLLVYLPRTTLALPLISFWSRASLSIAQLYIFVLYLWDRHAGRVCVRVVLFFDFWARVLAFTKLCIQWGHPVLRLVSCSWR